MVGANNDARTRESELEGGKAFSSKRNETDRTDRLATDLEF